MMMIISMKMMQVMMTTMIEKQDDYNIINYYDKYY